MATLWPGWHFVVENPAPDLLRSEVRPRRLAGPDRYTSTRKNQRGLRINTAFLFGAGPAHLNLLSFRVYGALESSSPALPRIPFGASVSGRFPMAWAGAEGEQLPSHLLHISGSAGLFALPNREPEQPGAAVRCGRDDSRCSPCADQRLRQVRPSAPATTSRIPSDGRTEGDGRQSRGR